MNYYLLIIERYLILPKSAQDEYTACGGNFYSHKYFTESTVCNIRVSQ